MKRILIPVMILAALAPAPAFAAKKKTASVPPPAKIEVSREDRIACMKKGVATQAGKPKPDKRAAFLAYRECYAQKEAELAAKMKKKKTEEKNKTPPAQTSPKND